MFTGLVQDVGVIAQLESGERSRRLVIECALDSTHLTIGASVSVSGVCLTVTASESGRFTAEAAFETLRATTLGERVVGDRVNLEPSLRLGDPLGGHLVLGHVDGVATVRSIAAREQAREFWIDPPQEFLPFIAAKGSVTIDGISLTVNETDARGFMLGIIPHTLSVTTLQHRAPGSRVNLEVDVMARYVARLLQFRPSGTASDGVSLELLQKAGFAGVGERP